MLEQLFLGNFLFFFYATGYLGYIGGGVPLWEIFLPSKALVVCNI